MTWLLPEQLTALTQLQAACDRQNAEVVIIGAAAYRTWFNDPGRHTEDLDVAVAIDLAEFTQLAEALAGLGWRQEARREHRWHTPGRGPGGSPAGRSQIESRGTHRVAPVGHGDEPGWV